MCLIVWGSDTGQYSTLGATPTAARALTAGQWANQAGMGGAMCSPRQTVATGAYPVKDGRREGDTVASGAGQEGQHRRQPKACFKACGGVKVALVIFLSGQKIKFSFSQIEARTHYFKMCLLSHGHVLGGLFYTVTFFGDSADLF